MEKDNDISDFEQLVTKTVVVEDLIDRMFASLVIINKTNWSVSNSAGEKDKALLCEARKMRVYVDQYITYLNKKVELCCKT